MFVNTLFAGWLDMDFDAHRSARRPVAAPPLLLDALKKYPSTTESQLFITSVKP
jgi:hypothetical protein